MAEICISDVYLGYISSAHGIQGDIKFKSFADLVSLKQYKVLKDQLGNKFIIKRVSEFRPNVFILLFEGIVTRNASETLKGKKLYIDRLQLKVLEDEDEFYELDLIGLEVHNEQNKVIGIIKNLINYGNNNIFEIKTSLMKEMLLIPFHREFVKIVDIEKKFIVLDSNYLQAFIEAEKTSV